MPAYTVINTTANLQVPLSVKVTGTEEGGGGGNSATPAFDLTTISGIVGLGSAMVYKWRKSDKRAGVVKDRTFVGAETTMAQAESLRQTDYGIEGLLGDLSKAINSIPGVPEESKKLISNQLEGWQKDNEAYYVKTPAKPTDLSSDPVVKKLGEVQKISERNPD